MVLLFGGWSAQAFTLVLKCHHFMNNICTIVVSFRAWSSGLLHVLVFRVRRFDSRRIQSKRARMMRDGVPEADLHSGQGTYEKALKTGFSRHISISPRGSHMSPTGHYTSLSSYTSCCLSYLSFSAEGLHRSTPLRRPFRRMVCTRHYLLVLFGGWSAEGSHMSPTGHYTSCCLSYSSGLLLGGWSAKAITYLSFSADGLQSSPTCPFR